MDEPKIKPPEDIPIWIDQDTTMIKTGGEYNDPIELNEADAKQLVDSLTESTRLISLD